MSKTKTLTHDEREQIKKEYLDAYDKALGPGGHIEYRRGWWYLSRDSISSPYSTKEIGILTHGLRNSIQ